MKRAKNILVIKLSALGDFVMAFPAFARIRAAHTDAKITLLTTAPFETLARLSPYFDAVETDGRPAGPGDWLRLITRLRQAKFDRAYAEEELRRWLRLFLRRFFANQFKRSCLPDGPKVGSISLSPRGDWRMPSDAVAALWLRWAES